MDAGYASRHAAKTIPSHITLLHVRKMSPIRIEIPQNLEKDQVLSITTSINVGNAAAMIDSKYFKIHT